MKFKEIKKTLSQNKNVCNRSIQFFSVIVFQQRIINLFYKLKTIVFQIKKNLVKLVD